MSLRSRPPLSPQLSPQVKARQTLAMTPAMRVALAVLAMPVDQLEDYVRDAVEQNPFLHRPLSATARHESAATEAYWEQLAEEASVWSRLESRIRELNLKPFEQTQALRLCERLDERGLLDAPLDRIAQDLNLPPALLEALCSRLQTIEPAGLFARDMIECWTLQLQAKGLLSPALRQVLAVLRSQPSQQPKAIAAAAGLDLPATLAALRQLQGLNSAPLTDIAPPELQALRPDLRFMRDEAGAWRVELLSQLPLRVDRALAKRTAAHPQVHPQGEDATQANRDYVKTQIDAAQTLVRAISQRGAALVRLGEFLLLEQQDFLETGDAAMRPLRMIEVAEALELHVSTISRLVADKQAETPWGLRALRQFFTHAVGNEDLSVAQVKARLQRLIQEERKPLSDQALADALAEQGCAIARRTVAKYRDALGIPRAQWRQR